MSDFDVLLLDFGGVCLLNPVELHGRAEAHFGLEPGALTWLGPVDPSTDFLWRDMIAGDLTEREYWAQRAAEVGALSGRELSTAGYMSALYDPPSDDLIRPAARATVERALAAGLGVSILTNDMRAFHGREWEHGIDFLAIVDHIVDCSDTDILKPDPRAFARAEEIVGTAASRMLFVDDQPRSVAAAEELGFTAMWFDISDPAAAWHQVAARLGV
ncbi:MAG: HAD-IA family hydrolase [Acidimicrobiales bacterium]|nr:HAD-IA family hydrolase [Acidimicrobiales bacterium]